MVCRVSAGQAVEDIGMTEQVGESGHDLRKDFQVGTLTLIKLVSDPNSRTK
jgi:hypothetical protein